MPMNKYKVTWDGKASEGIGCLTGHGIIEVDPIDGTTALVTVGDNGVTFEAHARTCTAILEWVPVHAPATPESFWGDDVDTFYCDSRGNCWLIGSVDWVAGYNSPEKQKGIPAGAEELDDCLLDDGSRNAAADIEAEYGGAVRGEGRPGNE